MKKTILFVTLALAFMASAHGPVLAPDPWQGDCNCPGPPKPPPPPGPSCQVAPQLCNH